MDNYENQRWFWGALAGIILTSLVWMATDRIQKNNPYKSQENVLPQSIVEAYNMGLKDALRTNPVSPQLDEVCLNLWANKQPYERPRF
jgi:hypothetical protein